MSNYNDEIRCANIRRSLCSLPALKEINNDVYSNNIAEK